MIEINGVDVEQYRMKYVYKEGRKSFLVHLAKGSNNWYVTTSYYTIKFSYDNLIYARYYNSHGIVYWCVAESEKQAKSFKDWIISQLAIETPSVNEFLFKQDKETLLPYGMISQ